MLPLDLHVLSLQLAFILSQDQTLHCKSIFSSVKMIFLLCSGCRKFIDLIQIPIVSSNIAALETSIDGSIFYLYYLYCLSIFQRTCCFRFKSGCKGKGFIFNYQTFSEVFFYFFLFTHFSGSLCERERMYKRKTKAVFFANRTAKIRTLFIIIQNFSEVFLFFSLSALSLFHYVNSARLSSLGKRVQKYTLLVYNPNILNYFFEVFLKESAKTLKDNDVVEHIFLS